MSNFNTNPRTKRKIRILFVFAVDQTSKNKIVEKPLVFIANPPPEARFLIDKNTFDKKPFYCFDFRKHYKNQWIFNDFVATSMILSHCLIARLNPKNVKFHWFSMVFWFLGFGPKSPIWRLLGLLAASVLASHFRRMLISKNHINPQLILPKMRFLAAHFGLNLAQNRVCSSKQKTHVAAVKLTFLRFYRS